MNFAIVAGMGSAAKVTGAIATAGAEADAGAASLVARHRKLTDAAQQFEGMLLEEMLKPMKENGLGEEGEAGDDDKDGSGFADTLSSYGVETMAAAIAKQGGLGIAKLVVTQVEGETGGNGVGDGVAGSAPK